MPSNARMSLMELSQSAVVDLQESQAFSEPFFVVVVEKEQDSESNLNESFGALNAPTQSSTLTSEGMCLTTSNQMWRLQQTICG